MFENLLRWLRPRKPAVASLTIRAGESVYLGKPAVPMNPSLVESLSQVVMPIASVIEAHVPQCYAPTIMKGAAQVLVVVFADGPDNYSETEALIKRSIAGLCPPKSHLNIWFIRPGHSMLEAVRKTNCRIK
jgi:hypothetical protein